MEYLHALILIPFYFCAAIFALPALIVVTRVLRIKVGINPLVYLAIGSAVAGIIVPLAAGLVPLHAYNGRGLLVMVIGSLLLAAVDSLLKRALPLPLDDELQHT